MNPPLFSSPSLVLSLYSRYAPVHPLLLQQEAAEAAANRAAAAAAEGEEGPTAVSFSGVSTAKVSRSACDVFAPQSLVEQLTCPICLDVRV